MENSMDFHLSNYYQSLQSIERRLSHKLSHEVSTSFVPKSYLPPCPDFIRKKKNSNLNAFSKKSHFDSNSTSKASTEIRLKQYSKEDFLQQSITRTQTKAVEITNKKMKAKRHLKQDSKEQKNQIILQVQGYEIGREAEKSRGNIATKEGDINLQRLLQDCSENCSKKSEGNGYESKMYLREEIEYFDLQLDKKSGEIDQANKSNRLTQCLIQQLKKRDRVFKMVQNFCHNKGLESTPHFSAIWQSYQKKQAILAKIQNKN